MFFIEVKGPCPVCEAPSCTCKGANEPYVGRPIDLAAVIERPDGSLTRIRAPERIYRDVPGQPGVRELLYNEGDFVREADAKALGLVAETAIKDKAKRGPREAPKPLGKGKASQASRDKALSQATKNEEE